MILGQMMRMMKKAMKAPRAIAMKKMEKKTRVALGALEHKHPAPKQRIKSLRLALQHAGPVGGVEL
jgi:hypothetical protein